MSRNQRSTNRLPLARKLEYHDRGSHCDDDDDVWECSACTCLNDKANHPQKCYMCGITRYSSGGSDGGGSDNDDDQTPVDRDDEEVEMEGGDDVDEKEEEEQPEVVRGGDNDFFTVNHVASIQVNNNSSKNNIDTTNENDSASSGSHGQPTTQPHKRKRIPNGILKKPTNIDNGSCQKTNGYNDGSDNSATGTEKDFEVFDPDDEIEELDDITTSPYLKGRSAEKNAEPFVRLKRLLHLPETSREAVEAFGGRDPAWATIKSYQLIEKSGMVYSQHWREGSIHGENFGKIPNHILVLLLQPMRFVKASETDLGAIVKELEVPAMIQIVVEEWDLEDEYPLVMSTDKIFHFSRRKRDCYRCALFLARLASCCKNFNIPLVGTSKKKAIECLDILEDHIVEIGVKSANQAKQVDSGEQQKDTMAKDNSSVAKSAPLNVTANKSEGRATTKKKKRGRPPERSSSPILSVQSDASSLFFDDGDEDRTDEPEIVEPPAKKKRGRPAGSKNTNTNTNTKKKGRSSSSANKITQAKSSTNATTTNGSGNGRRNSNKSSSAISSSSSSSNNSNTGHNLQQLIGRFEQKYHEMGELLEQIKTVAANSRSPTEQQIRDEVLEEVKSSLLGSLPKK